MKSVHRILLRLAAIMAVVGIVVVAMNTGPGDKQSVTAAIFGAPVLVLLALAWVFKPRAP